jgi:ribosome maturation factor RimP
MQVAVSSRVPSRPDVPRERLVTMLTPVVAEGGLDLEDIDVRPAGKRLLVRVVVDADGGAVLDAVAGVSNAVGEAIDESGLLGETPYVLEVTSPGVDRPLTEPRHWRRAQGRLVAVTYHQAPAVVGRLISCDDEAALLDVDGTQTQVTYSDVARAVVQVEFGKAAAEPPGDADEDAHADDEGEEG